MFIKHFDQTYYKKSVMHFPVIMKLCSLLLINQRVCSSSQHLVTKNETFSDENFDNVLKKFFTDLDKAFIQKYKPQHITVIEASENELQQVQPLFQNYLFIICKEVERCGYSERFSKGSIAIVFLEDLSEQTFRKYIKILSRCRKCRVLFLSKGIIQVNDIRIIFTLSLRYLRDFELAHLDKNVIKLYSHYITRNCSMEVRLDTVWRPEIGLDEIDIWTSRSQFMHGCPISVSSLTFTPKMMIKEIENGSLTIVGGREGKLLLTIASKLNFTIVLRYPSMADQLKYSRKEAILNDVASGISEIGIGRLRPINNRNNSITFSFWYDEECVTWGVPRVINWANDIVWVEFSWEVWASISLVFVIGCIIRYAHQDVATTENDQQRNLGFIIIFIDTLAVHLGNPVLYVSTSAGGKLMLIFYLYYIMVISTAYKTSLASILTTEEGTPTISDDQGIINANLNVGGSRYDYNILKDQVDDSEITAKLLERFTINNNESLSWDRLMFYQDFAFLARRSSLDYDRQMILKTHESVTYDVLDGCVLAHPTVMVFQKKSALRRAVDIIIMRLAESGILKHWDVDKFDADKLLRRKNAEKYYEERATHKFRNIFILYFFGISLALFTFLIELLTQWLRLKIQQRRGN